MSDVAFRAAAVTFLEDYRADAGIFLQVWPGRPNKIATPTGFVDRINRAIEPTGLNFHQSTVLVELLVLHGFFDSKDTVAKRDAFCDGFRAWAFTRFHQAGANTLLEVVGMDDDPEYEASWSIEERRVYYATRITLRGYAENAD